MMMLGLIGWIRGKRMARIRATVRVAGYAAVISGALGVWGVHKAHAQIAEGALRLGRDMMPVAEFIKEPTPLLMNGEHMIVATGKSEKNTHEVLDAYETFCRTSKDSLGSDWSDISKKAGGPIATKSIGGSFDFGVYRREARGEGVVMCFMRGEASGSSFTNGVRAFSKSHDLGALGKMRYAYVASTNDGTSFVFTAWTDDHFDIGAFSPENGKDAPGTDPAGLPRPPDATRIFSAQIAGTPFATHIYRAHGTQDGVRGFYDDAMSKAGWAPVGWGDPSIDPGKNRIYVKEGLQVALATTKQDDGTTLVSLGELGDRPNEGRLDAQAP